MVEAGVWACTCMAELKQSSWTAPLDLGRAYDTEIVRSCHRAHSGPPGSEFKLIPLDVRAELLCKELGPSQSSF